MSEELEQRLDSLYITPAAEITEENTYLDSDTDTFQFRDDAAVKIVIDDAEAADNYQNVNQWSATWVLSDILYQSPQSSSAFEGGYAGQANVPSFILSNHLSSIVPKIDEGLFYEEPPFLLRPHPGTGADVVQAKTALFSAQLEMMGFRQEVGRTLEQMALLGTGIMKWGYAERIEKEKKRRRTASKLQVSTGLSGQPPKEIDTPDSDEFETYFEDKKISHPWIKYCDIRTVLVNPGCRVGDIRKAGWVVYRDYATFADLDHLRDNDGYNIPAEDVLKELFLKGPSVGPDNITMTLPEGMMGYLQHALPRSYKTSADPMKNPIEILERWDNEKVIVIMSCNGHNILIRNEANPYGKIPFLSANWRNIPDCFYGQGLGQLIGAYQLVEQGITNMSLDLINYGLQPTAVRKKGFNVPTQNTRWRLGGIIDVEEDVDKAFKFLQMPPVPSEAWAALQQAQSSSAATSGANEFVGQGSSAAGTKTTGMRSGTGAAAVIQANASRLDGPSSRFVEQVFEPFLYILDELNNDLLPTSVLRDILGEELGEAYMVDHIKFRNARIEYEVLAGAKLGAKKSMEQFTPIILQMLNNPTFAQNLADAGFRFDAYAIFRNMAELSGWRYSQPFVVPMTPEQKQKHDANSPAALQANQIKAQQAMQLQKFQAEEQQQENLQLGKAANEVIRASTEHALSGEEENGEPSNQGFGSVTTL